MARVRKDVVVQIRLLAKIDTKLRRHVSKKGDVKTHILTMLELIDLNKCPVPDLKKLECGSGGYRPTTVNLPAEIYEWVERIAEARGCSINALMNGGIATYIKTLAV